MGNLKPHVFESLILLVFRFLGNVFFFLRGWKRTHDVAYESNDCVISYCFGRQHRLRTCFGKACAVYIYVYIYIFFLNLEGSHWWCGSITLEVPSWEHIPSKGSWGRWVSFPIGMVLMTSSKVTVLKSMGQHEIPVPKGQVQRRHRHVRCVVFSDMGDWWFGQRLTVWSSNSVWRSSTGKWPMIFLLSSATGLHVILVFFLLLLLLLHGAADSCLFFLFFCSTSINGFWLTLLELPWTLGGPPTQSFWELTYPLKSQFWRWFYFSQDGTC